MTLTLKILNQTVLENGSSPEMVLSNRGAKIGRAMTCEWVLPDESRSLSRQHCEIQCRGDDYFLVDFGSTSGTFVGDSDARLDGAHRIGPGDRFRIGPYVIEARLSGPALHRFQNEQEQAAAAAKGPAWGDWDDVPGAPPSAAPAPAPGYAADGGWDLPGEAPDRASVWSEAARAPSGEASANDLFGDFAARNEVDWSNAAWTADPSFDPFAIDPAPDQGFAPLGGAAASGPQPGSSAGAGAGTGDPFGGFGPLDPAAPAAPPAADPFGGPLSGAPATPAPFSPPSAAPQGLAADPFGGPLDPGAAPAPGSDPFGGPLDPAATPRPSPPRDEPTQHPGARAVPPSPSPPSAPAPAPAPAATPLGSAPARPEASYAALLGELGVPASQVTLAPEEATAKAGRMLRHLLAGLMILLEARARAKDEMGATGTALGFDGNNPLKFARNVDQALQMMLNPKMRGYMEAEDAIEEAYRDLQAHQIATLKAMQGALRETLDRFSPTAIKARTKEQGLLAKVLPGQREAALWKAYESQFSGVAEGSAEAFLEVFAKEFRRAYEEANRRPR